MAKGIDTGRHPSRGVHRERFGAGQPGANNLDPYFADPGVSDEASARRLGIDPYTQVNPFERNDAISSIMSAAPGEGDY